MSILSSRLRQTANLALLSKALTVYLSKIGAKEACINNVETRSIHYLLYHINWSKYNKFSTMPILAKESSVLKYTKVIPEAHPPCKGSEKAAGFDLKSAADVVVPARGKALIDTGLMIELPEGCYGRVAPRSGLAVKNFIDVGAGVIDEDYRGVLKVVLFNHSDTDFLVNKGDRIAQLICEKIYYPELQEVKELTTTTRGEGGFGSTGTN